MSISIWSSVEMDAVSRGFSYDSYVDFHKRTGCKGAKLSEFNYSLVRSILNESIDAHVREQRNKGSDEENICVR